MKTKKEIIENWLPRYTGDKIDDIGKHILLTNFQGYLDQFCAIGNTKVVDRKVAMPSATFNGITMINFGMGSANAATVMDLLSAASPKAVLFLGKCGGLKKKNE
ncbi:MAG: AMP nucleosidase, partial [Bacteroidetes bacterium]